MTLTRDSVLHYWSARYGINPRIGGRPVFTRNSAGLFTTQEGEVNTAIVNTPRFDWATVSGERRKVLTLELARTNNVLHASDFSNAAWTKLAATVGTGIPDPSGGTGACTLTATSANADIYQPLSDGSSTARTTSLWVRRRTGAGAVSLWKSSGGLSAIAPTADWQRFNAPGVASITRQHGITIATSGDAVDVWLAQLEDGPFATAGIPTTSAAATRAADSCYWNFPPVPQGMMLYLRFVEQGTIALSGNPLVLSISNAAGSGAFLQLYKSASYYEAYHSNGSIAVASTLAAAPVIGDTVELVFLLATNGVVVIVQSINGGAVTAGASSGAAALAAAWSDTRFWLNNLGTGNIGANKFAEVKVVKYADVVAVTNQGIMDELRALELGPNGDLL